jgi:hypothetical protein
MSLVENNIGHFLTRTLRSRQVRFELSFKILGGSLPSVKYKLDKHVLRSAVCVVCSLYKIFFFFQVLVD